MNALESVGILGGALVLGVGVPWLGVRMLAPVLAESPSAQATNYAGRQVFYGLGIVWLVWAGCAIVGGVVAGSVGAAGSLAVLTLAGPLALVAFALGVVDDAYGTGAARGFKGHLKAMLAGRLTTGGLKLVGIGLASLVVALLVSRVAPWGRESMVGSAAHVGGVVAAGASIALTSNFVNLMDLRPGRALKVYSALALAGSVVCPLGLAAAVSGSAGPGALAMQVAALAAFLLGPVLATWRFDLDERGMLGDAGANPMGAVAGLVIVTGLPLWALLAYTAAVFALNLASERVSYSRVIEANRVLAGIDGVGRRTSETTGEGNLQSGPPRQGKHE